MSVESMCRSLQAEVVGHRQRRRCRARRRRRNSRRRRPCVSPASASAPCAHFGVQLRDASCRAPCGSGARRPRRCRRSCAATFGWFVLRTARSSPSLRPLCDKTGIRRAVRSSYSASGGNTATASFQSRARSAWSATRHPHRSHHRLIAISTSGLTHRLCTQRGRCAPPCDPTNITVPSLTRIRGVLRIAPVFFDVD